MHFYNFNIGDYAKKTQHLTNEEDLAYRRLLDLYYDIEAPITHGLATLTRRLRVSEEALKNVLDEFFPEGRNKHADEEIKKYYAYLEKQKSNGIKGGRPKHKPTANPPVSQNNPPPSQPLTNNQEPNTNTPHNPPHTEIPDKPARKSGAIQFSTFLSRCKASNEKPMSSYQPVKDYAARVGLPEDFSVLCWNEFYRRHSEGGANESKKYSDWRRAFRNCLEGNWYKLWYLDDEGSFQLTTAGKIADKATE